MPPIKVEPGASLIRSGSIGELCAAYYASARFRPLKLATQTSYRRAIDGFQTIALPNGTKIKDAPVAGLKRRHLLAIMDKMADKPGASYSLLKRLKTLFDFAIEREYRTDNPASNIKLAKLKGFRPLSEEDISQYLGYWKSGTVQRRAILLLLYTGQRRSDAVRMGRQHVRDGRISVIQQKTGHRLEILIHPVLQAEIDLMPPDGLMFITGQNNKPYTAESFTNIFREWCREAGLPENSSPHGCRKAAGRRLAEIGCTAHQIMAILGHKSLSEAERYTRDADQVRLADAAIRHLS
ncbi:MAG: tyrosine-type recombinase/integrase [Asticcacaulis sp.]